MEYNQYQFKAVVWEYPGYAAWYFVTLPLDLAKEIKAKFGDQHRGWSSLPVLVTIGNSNWKTSIFFDKKADSYLLPLKAEVRKKEKIEEGHKVKVLIELMV